MNLISNFLYTLLAIVRKSPRADSEKVEISKDLIKSENKKMKKLNRLVLELLILEAELKKHNIYLKVKKEVAVCV